MAERKKRRINKDSDVVNNTTKKTVGFLLFFWVSLFLDSPCFANFYIDKNGIMHFISPPKKEREGNKMNNMKKYDRFIKKAQRKHGIESALIKAVIKTESSFNPLAVSPRGAKGLMQIMPDNFTALAISNPFDPAQNIMGGTRYLKKMIKRYDDNVPLALAAYNAGPTAVDKYGTIPPYKETQDYVKKVMQQYLRYKDNI
ncbi:MAG: lytic transglycosylase domain-containing protein [Lentisphaerae bacterium]|nr:lytic transglycosylase domain-containing protein [Lentisphaerota bacterium]